MAPEHFLDEQVSAERALQAQPDANLRLERYEDLQRLFRAGMEFDGRGLRRVMLELQSPTGTVSKRNGRYGLKDRLALAALYLRWRLAGFLLLRDGLAESVYGSYRELLERHHDLQKVVTTLAAELAALRADVTHLRDHSVSSRR
jgi:hypothetical protein